MQERMQETRMGVQGMSCEKCVANIEKVLRALPGVEQVAVSLAEGCCLVSHDPEKVTPAQLRDAIEAAGFDVTD